MRNRFISTRFSCLLLAMGLAGCGGQAGKGPASTSDSSKASDSRSSKKSKRRSERKSADAAYRRAINAEADGDLQAANDNYREALKLEPTHRKANQRYVHFLIDNGRESSALKIARAFFDEVPKEALSYHTLADAEAAVGDHQQVIGTMSGILAFAENDAAAFEKRGKARLIVGELEDGLKDIRRAVDLEPENSEFLVSLGAGLLRAGKPRDARSVLIKALEVDDKSARAHLLLGIVARSEGRMSEAVEHHMDAVELDAGDARAHYELGISHNANAQNDEAEASFAKAVEVDPNTGTYWYGYGDILRLLGRLEESAAAYRQSVRIESKNARAWERLGEVLIDSKEYSGAVKQLKKGIKKVSEARLHYLLGFAAAQDGRKDLAIEALEDYLQAAEAQAPDRKAADKLLKTLRR